MSTRREALWQSLALAGTLAAGLRAVAAERPCRIVLRSSWQTVNIGDIAHSPGVLALLERYLPGTEVRLWPSSVDRGVAEMIQRRFPHVALVRGAAAVQAAFDECDFLLHGSGPSLVAEKDVARWHAETGKPFGVYGITLAGAGAKTVELLNAASFVYFRDSVSLQNTREHGCHNPVMEFAPDGAFACDLRDDAKATAFMAAHGLETGQFLCCIPRLRYTPYWLIHPERARDATREQRNAAMAEHDHAPLREAITQVVRQTPLKVLLCPEDMSQMAVGKDLLYDKLPDDVRAKVVWRPGYWLTDEALSTYVRSAGLFGNEMHSPIMCIGNGIPAIVCRFAEQTSKGFMWRDIGLSDWLFDLDNEDDVRRIPAAVLAMAQDPAAAKAKVAAAQALVFRRQAETMAQVGKAAGVTVP